MKIRYTIPKRLRRDAQLMVKRANEILEEYETQGLVLTLRQLYYQFVAKGFLGNRQRNYKKLGRVIGDARLMGRVSWDAIEDRTRSLKLLTHFSGPQDALDKLSKWYAVDLWAGQKFRPEVWIEKDALTGVIEKVCDENDLPYFSCRGYTSLSEMWRASERLKGWIAKGQKPFIIHFGDHDPSGIDMSRDIFGRISQTFTADLEFTRVALTMDQVLEYEPPPNPAKPTDSRYKAYVAEFGVEESWELDALEPKKFRELIEWALIPLRDAKQWKKDVKAREAVRGQLQEIGREWQGIGQCKEDLEKALKEVADLGDALKRAIIHLAHQPALTAKARPMTMIFFVLLFSCGIVFPRGQVPSLEPAPACPSARQTLCRQRVFSALPSDSLPLCDAHETSVPDRAQFAIGNTPADNATHDRVEPSAVVQPSKVEPPNLFVEVTVQMKRRDVDVGAANHPFDQRPEIFDSVGVDLARHILHGMVDELMDVSVGDVGVALAAVRANDGIPFDVAEQFSHQRNLLRVRDDPRADLARIVTLISTLQHTVNDCLANAAAPQDDPLAFVGVHVLGLAADVGFVALDYIAKFAPCGRSSHSQADAVQHEPRGRLAHAKSAGQLATADAVLGVGDAPHGHEPRRQGERRILKDRADLRGELLAAIRGLALQHGPAGDVADLVTAAFRADDFAVRPFQADHVGVAFVGIGEMLHGFDQGLRAFGVHGLVSHSLGGDSSQHSDSLKRFRVSCVVPIGPGVSHRDFDVLSFVTFQRSSSGYRFPEFAIYFHLAALDVTDSKFQATRAGVSISSPSVVFFGTHSCAQKCLPRGLPPCDGSVDSRHRAGVASSISGFFRFGTQRHRAGLVAAIQADAAAARMFPSKTPDMKRQSASPAYCLCLFGALEKAYRFRRCAIWQQQRSIFVEREQFSAFPFEVFACFERLRNILDSTRPLVYEKPRRSSFDECRDDMLPANFCQSGDSFTVHLGTAFQCPQIRFLGVLERVFRCVVSFRAIDLPRTTVRRPISIVQCPGPCLAKNANVDRQERINVKPFVGFTVFSFVFRYFHRSISQGCQPYRSESPEPRRQDSS